MKFPFRFHIHLCGLEIVIFPCIYTWNMCQSTKGADIWFLVTYQYIVCSLFMLMYFLYDLEYVLAFFFGTLLCKFSRPTWEMIIEGLQITNVLWLHRWVFQHTKRNKDAVLIFLLISSCSLTTWLYLFQQTACLGLLVPPEISECFDVVRTPLLP